ncbi:MAG: TldD/PmbA family protein [Candidatus Schekmanbacteria bacterium]|nr:TldD/PmbA family protein [Candidatus Schekmanbacteria bacterium]
MSMPSPEETRALLGTVLSLSRAEACEVELRGTTEGNLRFARNTVTTSAAVRKSRLSVRSRFGQRSGEAATNEMDDQSLTRTVRISEELARLAPEDPELVEVLGPQTYPAVDAYRPATAAAGPELRATAAAKALAEARAQHVVAAGFFSHETGWLARATSKGLFGFHPYTVADFSVTCRTPDETGSGFAVAQATDVSRIDTGPLTRTACRKALLSMAPRAIDPGKYTVILEPAAVAEVLPFLYSALDARSADEGRSPFSKPGGGTRRGEKLFDERLTVRSDPGHADLAGLPWSDEGLPTAPTLWIENGVLKNFFYTRYWAQKQGVAPVPFSGSVVVPGTDSSVDELISQTKKGILITRIWYANIVDPQTLLVTGLTRDGTFWLEDGKISYPIKNLRFNQNLVSMFSQIEAIGTQARVNGDLVPALRVGDFSFTSTSDAT